MSKRFIGYGARQQRRDQRRTRPVLRFVIGGRAYDSVDWCLGGTLLEGNDGSYEPDQSIRIDAIGRAGESPIPLSVSARVVRFDPSTKRFALAFERLSAQAYSFLERLILRPGGEPPQVARTSK